MNAGEFPHSSDTEQGRWEQNIFDDVPFAGDKVVSGRKIKSVKAHIKEDDNRVNRKIRVHIKSEANSEEEGGDPENSNEENTTEISEIKNKEEVTKEGESAEAPVSVQEDGINEPEAEAEVQVNRRGELRFSPSEMIQGASSFDELRNVGKELDASVGSDEELEDEFRERAKAIKARLVLERDITISTEDVEKLRTKRERFEQNIPKWYTENDIAIIRQAFDEREKELLTPNRFRMNQNYNGEGGVSGPSSEKNLDNVDGAPQNPDLKDFVESEEKRGAEFLDNIEKRNEEFLRRSRERAEELKRKYDKEFGDKAESEPKGIEEIEDKKEGELVIKDEVLARLKALGDKIHEAPNLSREEKRALYEILGEKVIARKNELAKQNEPKPSEDNMPQDPDLKDFVESEKKRGAEFLEKTEKRNREFLEKSRERSGGDSGGEEGGRFERKGEVVTLRGDARDGAIDALTDYFNRPKDSLTADETRGARATELYEQLFGTSRGEDDGDTELSHEEMIRRRADKLYEQMYGKSSNGNVPLSKEEMMKRKREAELDEEEWNKQPDSFRLHFNRVTSMGNLGKKGMSDKKAIKRLHKERLLGVPVESVIEGFRDHIWEEGGGKIRKVDGKNERYGTSTAETEDYSELERLIRQRYVELGLRSDGTEEKPGESVFSGRRKKVGQLLKKIYFKY